MLFVFKTPVQISKRRAVLQHKARNWGINESGSVVVFHEDDWDVYVPLSSIRYWREEKKDDHQNQATLKAV